MRFRGFATSAFISALLLGLPGSGEASAESRGTDGAKSSRNTTPPTVTALAMGAAAAPQVDSAKVHHLYLEGEFPTAIGILEGYLKGNRQYSHGDSVFIFKHLGVMYAAQYDTREKGKYFMHRLLSVEPTARIMDMYASDMIYMIFKNIQEEYEQTRTRMGTANPESQERATLSPPHQPLNKSTSGRTANEFSSSGSGRKWVWAGMATAALAVGAAAYVLMNEDERKTRVVEKEF